MPALPDLRQWFVSILSFYEYGIIVYLFTLSTIYFVLLLIGFFEMMRHRFAYRDSDENRVLEASPLVPPVSILAPAYNEAASIRESVRAMLALTYPQYEVIVINDGSKDDTLQLLIEEFHLYRSARFYEKTLPGKHVDRKSTRLNSSHVEISYAVFCLKKKKSAL